MLCLTPHTGGDSVIGSFLGDARCSLLSVYRRLLNMSFSSSLEPFTSGLSQENRKVALGAVSSYILLGDYRDYRARIKALPQQHYSLFYRDVLPLLKTSFECRNIWRTIYYSLKHPENKTSLVAKKFRVPSESIKLVWGSLTSSDRKEVFERSKDDIDFGLLTASELNKIAKSLDKYCGRISYLKLRFLSDNDRAYSLRDFRNELLVKGVQTIRTYEHLRNPLMIENYAKAAIKNHASNLIGHYTSESRARVKNVTEGCGTCVFCLTGNPQKCADAVAAYSLTVVSIDPPEISSTLSSGMDIEKDLLSSSLVSHLKSGASTEFSIIIDMVFGDGVDDSFEAWLLDHYDLTVDSLVVSTRRYVKMLCRYHNIPLRDMTSYLRSKYDSYSRRIV